MSYYINTGLGRDTEHWNTYESEMDARNDIEKIVKSNIYNKYKKIYFEGNQSKRVLAIYRRRNNQSEEKSDSECEQSEGYDNLEKDELVACVLLMGHEWSGETDYKLMWLKPGK